MKDAQRSIIIIIINAESFAKFDWILFKVPVIYLIK